MGFYKVDFGDYCLAHNDKTKYLNYFEFGGKKYPIGSYVNLNDRGMKDMFYNKGHNYKKGGYRLVDHYITQKGIEEWTYIVGHLYNSSIPVLHYTNISPNDLLSEVLFKEFDECTDNIGELQVEFVEPNYSPKDCEVQGVILGWVIMIFVWIAALLLKDWWIRLLIQIWAGWYFGSWREKKINDAISKQKFKK